MGMFDDLEDFLDKNRKGKKSTNGRKGDGMFEEMEEKPAPKKRSRDSEGSDAQREIIQFLEKKFGGKAEVIGDGIISHEVTTRRNGGSHRDIYKDIERLKHKQDMMAKVLVGELQKAKVKPHCNDADGKALAEGDLLEVPGNQLKKIIKLGFGFAILSHTEDMERDDGVWFEEEIKDRGFRKK